MATKTLILRPVAVYAGDTAVTLYPSSTTIEQAHLLVNEEIADDDTTYITLATGEAVNYHFIYQKPLDLANVTNVVFHFRSLPETTGTANASNSVSHGLFVLGDNSYSFNAKAFGTSAAIYQDYDIEASNESTLSEVISIFNTLSTNDPFYCRQSIINTGNKFCPIRTTQMYVKITYETKEDSDINFYYVKNNDKWKSYPVAMYKKSNNVWVETTEDIFENNSRYVIKNI